MLNDAASHRTVFYSTFPPSHRKTTLYHCVGTTDRFEASSHPPCRVHGIPQCVGTRKKREKKKKNNKTAFTRTLALTRRAMYNARKKCVLVARVVNRRRRTPTDRDGLGVRVDVGAGVGRGPHTNTAAAAAAADAMFRSHVGSAVSSASNRSPGYRPFTRNHSRTRVQPVNTLTAVLHTSLSTALHSLHPDNHDRRRSLFVHQPVIFRAL